MDARTRSLIRRRRRLQAVPSLRRHPAGVHTGAAAPAQGQPPVPAPVPGGGSDPSGSLHSPG